MKKKQLTRRDFVRFSLATGIASGLSGTLVSCVSRPRRSPSSDAIATEIVYDFIVVGTGAGGAPVAARLAEAGYTVLCIEAGENYSSDKTNVPVLHPISTEDPRMSWNFFVRHNGGASPRDLGDTKFEADKGGILYPRASGIGGCTLHNAMITMYPDNKDWSYLEKLSGDSSWNPENMRRYFQKLEKNLYRPARANDRLFGREGWLATQQTSLKFLFNATGGDSTFFKIAEASARTWGLQLLDGASSKTLVFQDPNSFGQGPKTEGIYRTVSATEQGRRSGPKEFLLKTSERHHLDIVTGALATKVVFKNENGKQTAVGVECLINRETPLYKASPLYDESKLTKTISHTFKARREVILAGGAFNTPQLLMLSGIGDGEKLRQKGIPVLIDNPTVGRNLQDRYELGVVADLKEDYNLIKDCTFTPENDPCLDAYKKDPANHIYATNGVVIGHMVRSRHSKKDEDPDLFVFAAPGDFRGYVTGWSKTASATKNKLTWAILKAKTANTSGTVELRSNDPRDTPLINFNNFTDGKEDLESMIDGVNFARKVNRQSPLDALIAKEIGPLSEAKDERALKRTITQEAWGHHASCTCPMGREAAAGSVVDFDFKVHGTSNLRIVDASVFPKIPGHFIVTPIYMASEKAADTIIRQNKKKA